MIDGTETKGHAPIEWPVPPETARLIETWTSIWRPRLPGRDGETQYLFPGAGQGRQISANALAAAITDLIRRDLGLAVHPHLLRHFAAWRHLRRFSGQYEIVRRALGHSTVETTIRCYCGLEAESAARQFHRGLEEDRLEARRLVGVRGRSAARSRRK